MIRKLIGSVGGLVVLGIIAGGFWIYDRVNGNDAENAKEGGVGSCLEVSGTSIAASSEELDCDDDKAAYEIVAEGETKDVCDQFEPWFETTADGEKYYQCLWLNVEAGDCVKVATMVGVDEIKECGAGTNEVLLVDDKSADQKLCPKNTEFAYTNTTRKRLICFGPAAA